MLGKIEVRRRRGRQRMRGYHRLNGHEFEKTPEDSEGQGNLACCSSWGHRVMCDLVTKQQPGKKYFLGTELHFLRDLSGVYIITCTFGKI